jgi:lysophospholipase L1-like esterase
MLAELLVLCCFVSIARSLTFPNVHVKRNITIEALPRSVALRVLPLGDSITNGVGSTDGNGYRDIFVELAEQGGAVQMIGSHAGVGKMSNNQEEGWNGYTIDKISKKATNALEAKPNLVLLLAGTNNMNSDAQERSAPSEMEALIDKVRNCLMIKGHTS